MSRRRPNPRHEESDEAEEAQEEVEHVEDADNAPLADSEEEGEDLEDNAERDYQAIPVSDSLLRTLTDTRRKALTMYKKCKTTRERDDRLTALWREETSQT